MNKGYPPGTKCVITWIPPEDVEFMDADDPKIGEVVIVDDCVMRLGDLFPVYALEGRNPDLLIQGVGPNEWHYVDYMRPLEDPDTDNEREKNLNEDILEAYSEIYKAGGWHKFTIETREGV